MGASTQDQTVASRRTLAKKLDAVGWGLFFIWIGVALLAHIGWGVGLLGVGLITLGAQAARKYLAVEVEGFWVVVGLLFVLGGIWELLSVQVSLVPILLIVVGIILLVSTLTVRGEPR
jgi:hypothetical protein